MNKSDIMDECDSPSFFLARRRKLHTEAEQRRRDSIKRGFENLLDLLYPSKSDPKVSLVRISKATILNRSISVILKSQHLEKTKQHQIENLQKKIQALEILKSSYERVSSNSSSIHQCQDVITEQFKLKLFQMFMIKIFHSFDASVSKCALPELSEQIITWLENTCKPKSLSHFMEHLLTTLLEENFSYYQHLTSNQHSTQLQAGRYYPHNSIQAREVSFPPFHLHSSGIPESVHTSPFAVSESLNKDRGTVFVGDDYFNHSCEQEFGNISNHRVYAESHHDFSPSLRSSPPTPIHKIAQYQPTNDSANKYPYVRHSSPVPSPVFQRRAIAYNNNNNRSLVVDSTIPSIQQSNPAVLQSPAESSQVSLQSSFSAQLPQNSKSFSSSNRFC